MKKALLVVLGLAALVAIPVVVLASSVDEDESDLRPPRDIEVTIEFEDDGTTLTITGTASELGPDADPGSVVCSGPLFGGGDCGRYFTAIYDIDATHTGPDACEPSSMPSPLSFGKMIVGFWTVSTTTGEATLFAEKTGASSYVPLDEIGSVSIRDLRTMQAGLPVPGAGPLAVIHCGDVN